MNFRLLQHIVFTTWVALVLIASIPVGHQLITQIFGRTTTGTVTARTEWDPPYASWPHYNCQFSANGRVFTVENSILECRYGESAIIKIDPITAGRAQVDGDLFDNGTLLDWYFLGLSIIFVLLGLALKLTRFKAPWRTATLWLLDRIQSRRES